MRSSREERDEQDSAPAALAAEAFDPEQAARRREMVEKQIRRRGIHDERVLAAMMAVPRHAFVAPELIGDAYLDRPAPIGAEQTISQPYVVASMTEALGFTGIERVLEIGTGSGYQTAVLGCCWPAEVYTRGEAMLGARAEAARERLARLGYRNVRYQVSDGTLGWPEEAPFGGIIVTAAAPQIPQPLAAQLAEGGRMVLPVGSTEDQELLLVRRQGGELTSRTLYPCRFVPLVGRYGWSAGARENVRGASEYVNP